MIIFTLGLEEEINQARRAIHNRKKKKKTYICLSLDIQCELFDQLVAPILLHNLCELGKFSLSYTVEKHMVKIERQDWLLLYISFLRQLLHDKDIFKSAWIVKVKYILYKCGMRLLVVSFKSSIGLRWYIKTAME